MPITHSFSISCVRSVAGFFFSRANFAPLLSLYVFQDSGVICCLFFKASASALLTSCSGSNHFAPPFHHWPKTCHAAVICTRAEEPMLSIFLT